MALPSGAELPLVGQAGLHRRPWGCAASAGSGRSSGGHRQWKSDDALPGAAPGAAVRADFLDVGDDERHLGDGAAQRRGSLPALTRSASMGASVYLAAAASGGGGGRWSRWWQQARRLVRCGGGAGALVAVGAAAAGAVVGAGGLVAVGGTGVAVGVAPQAARATAPEVSAVSVRNCRRETAFFLDTLRPPCFVKRIVTPRRTA